MDSLVGITHEKWKALLKENSYQIRASSIPKCALISIKSRFISKVSRLEMEEYGEAIEQTSIKTPLIFILGHWRGGTTLLQNYLTLDDHYKFPTVADVLYPNNFLRMARRNNISKALGDDHRPMDNVRMKYNSPGEDEFALAVMTLKSPLFSWSFPRNRARYDRYLTFASVDSSEIELWKKAFLFYLKKLTLRYQKPLILKSPQHTARIKLLLEQFPHAKFIHIHRNPYRVFSSTCKLFETAVERGLLQRPMSTEEQQAYIITIYRTMYSAYFKDRELIPRGHIVEVAFEELEQNPLATLEQIYSTLNLPGYKQLVPAFEKEARKNKKYKKNIYQELPLEVCESINSNWEMSFEHWNYAMKTR